MDGSGRAMADHRAAREVRWTHEPAAIAGQTRKGIERQAVAPLARSLLKHL
jgi:hypothetical protein